jgi:hypothetical protein
MYIPDWFRSQLSAESDGRLRIRFSPYRGLYQIEAKRHRGKLSDKPTTNDATIREADGYDLVLEIAPTPRIGCPNIYRVSKFAPPVRCDQTVTVPVNQMKGIDCPTCKGRITAPYFELSAMLLEHLRYIDPDRDGVVRVFKDADDHEVRRVAALRRERHNVAEALFKEDRRQVLEIPMVGYSGRSLR